MILFLATPISSFKTDEEYNSYRKKVIQFISLLRKEHQVQSEIEKVESDNDYDSPEESFSKDLSAIQDCDAFILHYPIPSPTSALIELGIALALKKIVIIISPSIHQLPYLVQGIDNIGTTFLLVENERLGNTTANKIIDFLEKQKQSK